MTIAEQLERLQDCGIEPVSQGAIDHWVNEWGTEDLEERPFDLLVYSLGCDFEDAGGEWRPSSAGIWRLDTECIYEPNDYVNVARRLEMLTRGDVQLNDLEANLEGDAWLRFENEGDLYDWPIEVNDDWIDTGVIDRFAELLERKRSERRFFASVTNTQDCLIVCPSREEFDVLIQLIADELTPIHSAW